MQTDNSVYQNGKKKREENMKKKLWTERIFVSDSCSATKNPKISVSKHSDKLRSLNWVCG